MKQWDKRLIRHHNSILIGHNCHCALPKSLHILNSDQKGATVQNLKNLILETLSMVPSADNTQPWKIAWTETPTKQYAEILHDGAVAFHSLNSKGMASLFSLGFVIESLALAATQLGFKTQVVLRKSQWQNLEEKSILPVAQLIFTPSLEQTSQEDKELFEQIKNRHTHRGLYNKEFLNSSVLQSLNEQDSSNGQSRIHYMRPEQDAILTYISQGESLLWKETKLVSEIAKWVRFTQKEVEAHNTGLNGAGLGFSKLELLFLKFITQHPTLLRFFAPFIGNVVVPMTTKKLIRSSSALSCVTVKQMTPEALIDAGRLMMFNWLRLTKMGFVIHPYTIGSLNLFNLENNSMPGILKQNHYTFFVNGLKTVSKFFKLGSNETPVFMFRLGKAAALRRDQQSKRRPTSELLDSYQYLSLGKDHADCSTVDPSAKI